jgi:hypothetical protein
MSTVVMHNVVSVDGFIADHNDDVEPLFDWYFNGDTPLIPGEMDDPSPERVASSCQSDCRQREQERWSEGRSSAASSL